MSYHYYDIILFSKISCWLLRCPVIIYDILIKHKQEWKCIFIKKNWVVLNICSIINCIVRSDLVKQCIFFLYRRQWTKNFLYPYSSPTHNNLSDSRSGLGPIIFRKSWAKPGLSPGLSPVRPALLVYPIGPAWLDGVFVTIEVSKSD